MKKASSMILTGSVLVIIIDLIKWLTPHGGDAILGSQAGVKHPDQNTSFKPFPICIMFKFSSSAIENISDVQDGKVVITFNGGRHYTYKVSDPTDFVEQLQRVISSEESVGKFINSAIRSNQLENLVSNE